MKRDDKTTYHGQTSYIYIHTYIHIHDAYVHVYVFM